jgi:hypothetical protein
MLLLQLSLTSMLKAGNAGLVSAGVPAAMLSALGLSSPNNSVARHAIMMDEEQEEVSTRFT